MYLVAINAFASCSRPEGNSQNQTENPQPKIQTKMKITIGNQTFTASFANTISVEEFQKKLPLTLEMQDYGGFEKMVDIGKISSDDKIEKSVGLGDILLYSSKILVLQYASNGGFPYTRIGKIDNPQGLKEALGKGNVSVKFELID